MIAKAQDAEDFMKAGGVKGDVDVRQVIVKMDSVEVCLKKGEKVEVGVGEEDGVFADESYNEMIAKFDALLEGYGSVRPVKVDEWEWVVIGILDWKREELSSASNGSNGKRKRIPKDVSGVYSFVSLNVFVSAFKILVGAIIPPDASGILSHSS